MSSSIQAAPSSAMFFLNMTASIWRAAGSVTAQLSGVATHRLSAARTAGLVIGIGAVVGVIVGLSAMQGGLENWGQ